MKYIVTYLLISYISSPCPDKSTDEFGRLKQYECLVNHMEMIKQKKQKYFNSLDSANKFISEASKIKEIDSIKITWQTK